MNGFSQLSQLKAQSRRTAGSRELEGLNETTRSIKNETKQSDMTQNSSFDEELMDAAEKVEGYMISFLVKQMRDTVKRTKGLFERGQAEKIFQSRLDDKFAQRMAESKNFGIAESVYNQFSANKVK